MRHARKREQAMLADSDPTTIQEVECTRAAVRALLNLVEDLHSENQRLRRVVGELRDEVNRLGREEHLRVDPSRLPAGAERNGYATTVAQNLRICADNARYELATRLNAQQQARILIDTGYRPAMTGLIEPPRDSGSFPETTPHPAALERDRRGASMSAPAPRDPYAPATEPAYAELTNREMEVLSLMAERLTNREIAEILFVSPHTVRNHVANIFQKLQVTRRREAVELYLKQLIKTSQATPTGQNPHLWISGGSAGRAPS